MTDSQKEKLIENIKKGWGYFAQEGIDSYDEEILIAFAEAGTSFMHLIPDGMKTESVSLAAAKNDKTNQCLRCTPTYILNYREVAQNAIASGPGNLVYLPMDIVNTKFILETADLNPTVLPAFFAKYPHISESSYRRDELEHVLKQNSAACSQFIGDFLRGKIQSDIITDEFIKDSLIECRSLMFSVLKSDKKNLALEVVSGGLWPTEFIDSKPTDLGDCVRRMMKPKNSSVQEWQKAYAMTFGIDAVVKIMQTPARIELLEQIYPRSEILPHLKGVGGKRAKGKWLEEDLGM